MANLQKFPAKICLTAAGCLIYEGRVLLVKHKKVKAWLNPGGHLEKDELPHRAAEREFWEETGIKVKATDPNLIKARDESEYLPNPFITNLHWVSKPNYQARKKQEKTGVQKYKLEKEWQKGCEQHLSLIYLVKPTQGVDFKENVEETDGIAWFTQQELKDLDTYGNVQQEVNKAFELVKNL